MICKMKILFYPLFYDHFNILFSRIIRLELVFDIRETIMISYL